MITLDPAVQAAIDGQDIWPVRLMSIEIGDVIYYITDHYKNLTVGTQTYIANGDLLSIDNITDTTQAGDQNLDITLSGIDSMFRQDVLAADSIGGLVTIDRGFLSTSTANLLADPNEIFRGIIFSVSLIDDPGSLGQSQANFSISVDVRSVHYLVRTIPGRFTEDNSQRNVDPDDASMSHVASLDGSSLEFGGE